MIIGTAFIYSATANNDMFRQLAWYRQPAFKQIAFYTLAWVAQRRFVSSAIAGWRAGPSSFTGSTILLLVAVLIPSIGTKVFGARRWIDLGFFNFQPSEFAKLAFILVQAHFLSRPVEELRCPAGSSCKALGLTVLPFLLILREPDLGSALVLLPITLVMMFTAGVPVRHLRRLVTGAGLVVALIVVDVLFAPATCRFHWKITNGIACWFISDETLLRGVTPPRSVSASYALQQKKSYNVEQALISVGSGGLTGKGWRQGTQNALGYLPRAVAHNDFIFSVIAEEKGFVGSVIVLTLYTVVLFTRNQNCRPGARSPGQTAGGGRRHAALQPCLHQYRHEHSLNACDGYSTAAA